MIKRTRFKQFLTAICVLSIATSTLYGCGQKNTPNISITSPSSQVSDNSAPVNSNIEFDDFLHDLFLEEVSSDSITLNYKLADYKAYGLTEHTVGYGDLDISSIDDTSEVIDTLNELKKFDYNTLSSDQQRTYDILKNYIETQLEYTDSYLYGNAFSPTLGVQTQLPITLAEFSFRTVSDIDDYLTLLNETQDYFDYLLRFSRLQADEGIFMENYLIDQAIDQCELFIENPEDNYLIAIFDDKIKSFEGLSDSDKERYIKDHKAAILNSFVPAYKYLISGLKELKDTNKYPGGLCNYPDGMHYYEGLLKIGVGTDKTVAELDKLLDKYLYNAANNMVEVMNANPTLADNIDAYSFCSDDPYIILDDMFNRCTGLYPDLPECNYTVKYVHPSLEEYSSPAFYMIPAVDDYLNNNIYINQKSMDEGEELYPTLAHEGFPGHLLQTVYFLSTNPAPIRTLVDYSGYTEGWATYVENQSYYMGGIDANAGSLLANNYLTILCLYGKMDIGVNAYGWTIDDLHEFINTYLSNISYEASTDIYYRLVADPSNYLNYIIGCLEIMEIKEQCMNSLGVNFDLLKFHTAVLDAGPCTFKELSDYVKKALNIKNTFSLFPFAA